MSLNSELRSSSHLVSKLLTSINIFSLIRYNCRFVRLSCFLYILTIESYYRVNIAADGQGVISPFGLAQLDKGHEGPTKKVHRAGTSWVLLANGAPKSLKLLRREGLESPSLLSNVPSAERELLNFPLKITPSGGCRLWPTNHRHSPLKTL